MLETHPFGIFVPLKAKYLLLGSFTTKEAFDKTKTYDWFYSNGRNQFWPLLEVVYGHRLQTKKEKQALFADLKMALGDIIYQCERKKHSNLDMHLVNIVYALEDIAKTLENNPISKIFFTSRYVETKFRRVFKKVIIQHPNIELLTLPSPSPRYATMTKSEKIKRYIELLPRLPQ